jgi:glycosyltransferase involved in cell wall biosynthesis
MSEQDSTKVLIVSQFYPPESMGGAHRWEKISRHLDDSIEPHVLTTFPTFPFGEFERRWRPVSRETREGVPVTRLFTYQPESDSTIGRIFNYGIFSVLSTIYVLLTFWRYDCVVTMSAPHTTFLPGLVGKLTGRVWVIDIFDLWLDNAADLGYVDEDSFLFRAVGYLERVSFAKTDEVFVITETMAAYYEAKHPSTSLNISVIPFGVNVEMFSPDIESEYTTDVIYAGNLGTGQSFIPFLEGFVELSEDVELTIVGDGERREELQKFVRNRDIDDSVHFTGYVDRSEIPGRVAGATVSLVPLKTDYELDYACPTKLLESMSVGTPFVASAVAEIEKASEESDAGIAVENEATHVKEALEELLTNREMRKTMGWNGVEHIENNHDWKTISQDVAMVLSK